MSNSVADSTRVTHWCHICSCNVFATLSTETEEFNCTRCGENFVEALGQGVEGFLSSSLDATTARTNDEALNLLRSSINGALGTVMGNFGGGPAAYGPGGYHRIAGTAGRPVGVIVHTGMVPNFNSFRENPSRTLDDLIHHLMMSETSYRTRGTLQTVIDSLERLRVDEHTNTTDLGACGISMEDFTVGDVVVTLPCKHAYKEELIVQWLKSHHTCPTCRFELPEDC